MTTTGTGVDSTILSTRTTYDDVGRREKVATYSSNDCDPDNMVNQVVWEYGDFGTVSKEYQEHEGARHAHAPFTCWRGRGESAPDENSTDRSARQESVPELCGPRGEKRS